MCFACDNRIGVAVTDATPRYRSRNATGSQGTSSVRRSYAVHTLWSTIRHSIASDALWIRKVRHRYAVTALHAPHARDRLTYHVAVAYQAIKLRLYLRSSCVTYVLTAYVWRMYGESKLLRTRGDFFNMFKNSPRLCEPSRMRRSCNVTATEAFDAVTMVWRSLRIVIRLTFAGRFVNVEEQYYAL